MYLCTKGAEMGKCIAYDFSFMNCIFTEIFLLLNNFWDYKVLDLLAEVLKLNAKYSKIVDSNATHRVLRVPRMRDGCFPVKLPMKLVRCTLSHIGNERRAIQVYYFV